MGSTTMTTSSTDSIGDDNHDAAANHEQNLQAAVLNGGGLFSFPTGYLNGRGAPSWVLSDAEHQQQHSKKKKHHHLQQEEHSNNDHEREADKTTGMADILVSLRQSITDVNGDAAGAVTGNKHPHHPHSPDSNDIDDEDRSSGATNNTPKGGILLNGVPLPGGVGKSSNAEKKVDRILVKPASEHDAGGTDEMLAFDRKNMPVR
jgi:predicted RNA-binding protein YlxR (DUF448 family)